MHFFKHLDLFSNLDKMRVNVELISGNLVKSLADSQHPARYFSLGRGDMG